MSNETDEFLKISVALNAAIVAPMLDRDNISDTRRDFGELGLDILQRWQRALAKWDGVAP